jgi:carbon monoxide dehydrogenase subunit G
MIPSECPGWQNARVRIHIEERVAVAAPPLVVWEALTDWEGQSSWMLATTVTAEPGGHRTGERLEAVTRVVGVGFSDPMEVIRWDPPRRVDVAHTGRVVRGTGTFAVEPAPGGAWCVWAEDLDLPLGSLGRLGFVPLRPAFRLMLRRSLRRLARQLERRPRRPGG